MNTVDSEKLIEKLVFFNAIIQEISIHMNALEKIDYLQTLNINEDQKRFLQYTHRKLIIIDFNKLVSKSKDDIYSIHSILKFHEGIKGKYLKKVNLSHLNSLILELEIFEKTNLDIKNMRNNFFAHLSTIEKRNKYSDIELISEYLNAYLALLLNIADEIEYVYNIKSSFKINDKTSYMIADLYSSNPS